MITEQNEGKGRDTKKAHQLSIIKNVKVPPLPIPMQQGEGVGGLMITRSTRRSALSSNERATLASRCLCPGTSTRFSSFHGPCVVPISVSRANQLPSFICVWALRAAVAELLALTR